MNPKESAVHFDGSPCKSCGGTKRYVRSHSCVACALTGNTSLASIQALKQLRLEVQMAAQERGDPQYQGHDCRHRHGGMRYASNGRCVGCSKAHTARSASRNKRQPGEASPSRPAVARPNPTPPATAWVSSITPPSLAMLMARR